MKEQNDNKPEQIPYLSLNDDQEHRTLDTRTKDAPTESDPIQPIQPPIESPLLQNSPHKISTQQNSPSDTALLCHSSTSSTPVHSNQSLRTQNQESVTPDIELSHPNLTALHNSPANQQQQTFQEPDKTVPNINTNLSTIDTTTVNILPQLQDLDDHPLDISNPELTPRTGKIRKTTRSYSPKHTKLVRCTKLKLNKDVLAAIPMSDSFFTFRKLLRHQHDQKTALPNPYTPSVTDTLEFTSMEEDEAFSHPTHSTSSSPKSLSHILPVNLFDN
jgi:hypothetical protein